uniref:Calx-beta domain-containing protein n=1 Tax=Parascaris univalens TaxID=6257 RepID=A0A914ZN79_PARUN
LLGFDTYPTFNVNETKKFDDVNSAIRTIDYLHKLFICSSAPEILLSII